jgi:hypothetical protein
MDKDERSGTRINKGIRIGSRMDGKTKEEYSP